MGFELARNGNLHHCAHYSRVKVLVFVIRYILELKTEEERMIQGVWQRGIDRKFSDIPKVEHCSIGLVCHSRPSRHWMAGESRADAEVIPAWVLIVYYIVANTDRTTIALKSAEVRA